ncbi:hypothetical protein QAD02_024193 [Eretmocerus hayati]|uniref:Uncharacterized protein n=1 Tax=Eretmocerus hayati TaxID=131215 RepID=A0ACC2PZ51_9HYME|nr:hypothetical protein QAD02_024193 [Eretmocerus hayati]
MSEPESSEESPTDLKNDLEPAKDVQKTYVSNESVSLAIDEESAENKVDNAVISGLQPDEHRQPIDLQLKHVGLSVPIRATTTDGVKKRKLKRILVDVSGELHQGRVTAILGPSGAGKTSLLRLLANRARGRAQFDGVEGQLLINGSSSVEDEGCLSACYVPQEFALMPLLTTRETIQLAARLKLPSSSITTDAKGANRRHVQADSKECKLLTPLQRQQHGINELEEIVERLGMLECMDTLVQVLSGGEKKRLSIAVEMITRPSLMLLDEPTSGLDSASSNQVARLLRTMASSGCTVICSLHQPSSRMLNCIDDVLLLSRGRCCYCGPRQNLLQHFNSLGYVCPPFYNLAEFAIEVVTGERGGDYEKIMNKSSADENIITEDPPKALNSPKNEEKSKWTKRYAVSSWEQQKVLLHRAFIIIKRDNKLTKLRLAAHLVVAILLGLVFQDFGGDADKLQSNIACLFFFPLFLFFANAMPAVEMFPTEAAVFLRENTNNWYSLESYYFTKVLSDLPLQIICPTIFVSIAYYMTGQPLEMTRFSQVWLLCTLLAMIAQSFGIAIGAAFNTEAGVFLVPASNIPMFLFAGFFIRLKEVPFYLRFIGDISYFRYAFEGVMQAVYVGRARLPCSGVYCPLRHWDRILDELDMPSVEPGTCSLVLSIWVVLIHLVVYAVLKFKLSQSNS